MSQQVRTAFSNYYLSTMLPAIEFAITEESDRRPDEYPKFLNVSDTTQSIVQETEVTGLGTMVQTTEGGRLRYDAIKQAYSQNYVPVDWGLGYRVSHRMMADDKFGLVKAAAKALVSSAKETVEIEAANIYNRAFNSSYLGPDGKTLCATDHPLVGGGTQANRPATDADLDIASLEAANTAFRKLVDHRGKKARLKPQTLVVAPAGQYGAIEILKSPQRSDTANNAVNAFANGAIEGGMLQWAVYDYLTDDDAWFLIAPVSDLRARFIWRERFVTTHAEDFDTRSLKTAGWQTFITGFGSYLGIYGTQGA
jgi:hypothetical protein